MDETPCPHYHSGLAIIDSKLTAVGGGEFRRHSNALQGQEELVEVYPPMNTARSNPAVVCTSDGDYLIVVGRTDSDGWTATVELFEGKKMVHTNRPTRTCRSAFSCNSWRSTNNVTGHDDKGYSSTYQPVTNRSHHLSPSPGNPSLVCH